MASRQIVYLSQNGILFADRVGNIRLWNSVTNICKGGETCNHEDR
jgi:hypothetical protein